MPRRPGQAAYGQVAEDTAAGPSPEGRGLWTKARSLPTPEMRSNARTRGLRHHALHPRGGLGPSPKQSVLTTNTGAFVDHPAGWGP